MVNIAPNGPESICLVIPPEVVPVAQFMAISIVKFSDELEFIDMSFAIKKDQHLKECFVDIYNNMNQMLPRRYSNKYRKIRTLIKKAPQGKNSPLALVVRRFLDADDPDSIVAVIQEMERMYQLGPNTLTTLHEIKKYYKI